MTIPAIYIIHAAGRAATGAWAHGKRSGEFCALRDRVILSGQNENGEWTAHLETEFKSVVVEILRATGVSA